MSRPITMTVYLFADDDENPHKWDVAEWLNDPSIVGWEITEGHGDCPSCAALERTPDSKTPFRVTPVHG